MLRIDEPTGPPLPSSVVSIGNFDGVHVGHAQLLRRLVARARLLGVPSVVVTFDPHPLKVLRPDKAPLPITGLDEKARRLEQLGLDVLLVLHFDEKMARLEPLEFLDRSIVARLHPRLLVVGHDFNFGKDRRGTIELLKVYCRERDIELEVIDPVESGGQRISSTEIRQALGRGDLREANALMGHPYRVSALVVTGDRRGATLGFPTANLHVPELLLPRGVYRAWALWPGGSGAAAVNVGGRPTFGDGQTVVEVHVVDQKPQLYGERLDVEFHERLRAEMRFTGAEQLKEQILADVAAVRAASLSVGANEKETQE